MSKELIDRLRDCYICANMEEGEFCSDECRVMNEAATALEQAEKRIGELPGDGRRIIQDGIEAILEACGSQEAFTDYDKRAWDALMVGSAALAELEQQWVPCSERMPEEGQHVLCCVAGGTVSCLPTESDQATVIVWDEDCEFCIYTHWMPLSPLPTPPGDS